MADFYARVQINDVPLNHASYDELHKAMHDLGYEQWIALSNQKLALPHASYFGARLLADVIKAKDAISNKLKSVTGLASHQLVVIEVRSSESIANWGLAVWK